jgi:murein endopeptidase
VRILLGALALLLLPAPSPPPRVERPLFPPIDWRQSRPVGTVTAGGLLRGVRLPAEGEEFFTWDPVLHRRPNPAWRRWGTDDLVRTVLGIVDEYAAAHPGAPRIGIGDLSRPRGGYFGPKHVSHQNGLDVDVYYPRLDRSERPPKRAAQIDRRLGQDLVDRFVAAGAATIYVGPNTGFRGPRKVVEVLWNHDNHLHARFAWPLPG